MQISPNGLRFIQSNEGYSATVYKDVAGYSTIGYGHKLMPEESFPNGITQAEAAQILDSDLALIELTLAHLVPQGCTQNQWDALCDFAFNLGVGALKTLLAHGWDNVPIQMMRWIYAGGEAVPGLKKRREAEVQMFTS